MSALVSRWRRWKHQGEDTDTVDKKLDFDGKLLSTVKSGFRPLFVRNTSTTIYFVPPPIYKVKPAAYLDRCQYFSIALDFNILVRKWDMSAHMHSILSRNGNFTFEDYIHAMDAMRNEIRMCHLTPITVDFKCLVNLVLSCSQILDCLLLFQEERLTPEVDQACTFALQDLWVDMLLVQNQVPFFGLQRMYDMAIVDKSQYPSLVELSLRFFEQFLQINRQTPLMESASVHHLLHLVHHHLLPSSGSPVRLGPFRLFFNKMKSFIFIVYIGIMSLIYTFFKKMQSVFFSKPHPELPTSEPRPFKRHVLVEPIPSARRLQDAGIKFRKSKDAGFSIITFHKGVLEIPHIRVDNNTEFLLRNLTVWEQCHLTVGAYFTSYSIFMDYIINTAEDVDILNRHGVIEQTLGSEDQVASIFNGLSTNIAYIGRETDFLHSLCKELNEYCHNRFNRWWATLMINYFSSPWTIMSVIAAIFLLFLTATQTFFSVYAYYRPP